ncbi:MAG: IS3 family transposase [Bacteroidota bacterium]
MSAVLQVSRSGYYAWLKRPQSDRSTQNEQLVKQIKEIHHQSRQTYGSPRVYDELQDRGIACSENRVARLMQRHGIAAFGARLKRKRSLLEQLTRVILCLLP